MAAQVLALALTQRNPLADAAVGDARPVPGMQDEQQALLAKAARAATNALGGLATALGAGAAQGLLQNRLARPWSLRRLVRPRCSVRAVVHGGGGEGTQVDSRRGAKSACRRQLLRRSGGASCPHDGKVCPAPGSEVPSDSALHARLAACRPPAHMRADARQARAACGGLAALADEAARAAAAVPLLLERVLGAGRANDFYFKVHTVWRMRGQQGETRAAIAVSSLAALTPRIRAPCEPALQQVAWKAAGALQSSASCTRHGCQLRVPADGWTRRLWHPRVRKCMPYRC